MSLDYPDMDPVGTDGSITYGDFGPAREEVQKASGLDCKNYNIEISVFNGMLITKGIISEDGKMIYSIKIILFKHHELYNLLWTVEKIMKIILI